MTETADDILSVTFGSRTVRFFPLGLGWLRRNGETVQKLREGGADIDAAVRSGEKLGVLIAILHASAKRGDPMVTEEDVEAVVDVRNMGPVMQFVMGNSGFRPVPAGRADDPTSPRIGGESTQP
jgi:hypothetical protein